MAAGNDTVNIKVKYIPDTSALKNIKEIKMPEIKVGGKDAGKGVFDSYNNAIRDLNRELSKGTDASAITKAFKTVGEETQKVKTQINSMKEAINQSFQSPSNQSLIKDYQNLEKQLKKLDAESQKRRKKSAELSSFKSQNNMSTPQARKEISKAEALVTSGEKLTKQDQERLEIAKQIIAKEEELAKLRTQEEIRNAQKDIKNQMSDSKYDSMISSTEANRILGQYNDILSRVGINLNGVTGESKKFSSSLDEQVNQVKAAKKEVVKFGDIISGTFLGTSLSNLFQTGLSRGIEFFKDYDEILTRTMMVTTMTRDEVNNLTLSYNKLANQLSSTTKDVAAAQLVFYQQGLRTSEALKMTEASIAISKTGGIESEEAANRLTAAVRGYQLSASEAMDIADKMSALDAAAASSVDELTIAMQKSASQARMAGLDLDYYMAYLSTMQEVTREAPENIGTAMKSITSRLQEIKDIGKIEEDGTTFSNVAKALTSIGIAATDSSGQLRTLQDIMNELGPMWDTLDRNHKAYIATVLAGNRQQSRFIALMDNYDRAMELVSVSQNASGETSKQLRDYNTGLEASFLKLSNAWQQFATKITDSSAIKTLVDSLTDLLELVNSLPNGLVRFASTFLVLSKTWTTISKLSKNSDFGSWFGKVTGIKDFSSQIQSSFDSLIKSVNSFKNSLNSINGVEFGKTTNELDKMNTSINTMSASTSTVAGNMTVASGGTNALSIAAMNTAKEETELGKSIEQVGFKADGNDAAIDKEIKSLENLKDQATNVKESYDQLKEASSTATGKGIRFEELKKQLNEIDEATKFSKDTYEKYIDNLEEEFQKTNPKEYQKAYKKFMKQPEGRFTMDFGTGENREERLSDFVDNKDFIDKLQDAQVEISTNLDDLNTRRQETMSKMVDLLNEIGESKESLEKNTDALDKNTQEHTKKETKGSEEKPNAKTNEVIEKNQANVKTQPDSLLGSNVLDDTTEGTLEDDILAAMPSKFDKVKNKIGETTSKFKELHVASKAFSAFTIGSMISLAANYIPGVNDELANTIGLFAGMGKFGKDIGDELGKLFPKIGAKGGAIGTGIAIAISAGITAWKAVDTAAKKAEKNLNESLDAWNKTSEAYLNMRKMVDVYDELSGKINKTTEEQERLNDAIQELSQIAPKAVVGYDLQGNAIIDASKIDEAMNDKRIENAENANKTVLDSVKKANADAAKEADKFQHKMTRGAITTTTSAAGIAAGVWGAGKIGALVGSAAGPIGTAVGAAIGAIAGGLAGYFTSKKLTDQIEKDAKAQALYSKLQEQSSTIVKGITEQSANAILEGTEEGTQDRQELAAYLTKNSFDEFAQELVNKQRKKNLSDKKIEELTSQYQADMNDAFSKLSEAGGLDKINETISSIQTELNKGATWSQVSSTLDSQLNTIFANAGIDDETANKLIGGIQNKIFANLSGNIPAMQKEVQRIIDEILKGDSDANIDNLKEIKERLGGLNQGAGSAIANSGLMNNLQQDGKESDQAKLLNMILEKSEELNKASMGLDGTLNESGSTIKLLSILYSDLGEEMNKVKGDAIKAAFSTLEATVAPTFEEIGTQVEKSIEGFNTLIEVIDTLKDSGGAVDLETFTSLFSVLDEIGEAAYSDFKNVQMYTDAFNQLANGMSVVNGEMQLQADAVQALAEIKRLAFISEIKQQLEKVNADIEANKFQKKLMEAQMEALKAGLAYEGDVAGAEVTMEQTLRKELNNIQGNWLTSESKIYANYVGMVNSALNTAANSFKKFYAAINSGNFSGWKNLTEDSNTVFKGIIDDFVDDSFDYSNVDAEDFNKIIKTQIEGLKDAMKANDLELSQLEAKKAGLTNILKVAEAGNGALGKFSKGQTESASEYNEQLKETLTLLEKIAGIAHKLSENEDFKSLYEGWNGEKDAKYLLENLKLYEAQYEVQKDLFDMQQRMTNQAAGDLLDSPYGYLFKIMDNGDIGWADESMYNIYKNLPDEMQEDIDDLVQAFQEQRDALRDTELSLQDYAKAVKKAREEIRDLTIDAEDTIVEALKNREKILHDARVKALDDEIDMIEKAVEARKKAREDDDSNKELYKAQEALRRATLDSSGKNNAQLLQLQQDLEDKQLEISEKRFEDDMDDRKQWLQDTKDAESETYDYRLEKMTWYWEQVTDLMERSTDEIMNFLISWDEEYRQTSATQQEKLKEQWEATFSKLKTITESLNDPIEQLKTRLSDVTSEVEDMNIKVQALAGQWNAATAAKQAYANTSSGRGSGGSYPGNGGEVPKTPEDELPEGSKTGNSNKQPDSKFKVGDKVTSAVGILTDGYAYDKSGNIKKPVTNKGMDTNKMWLGSGDKMYVTKVEYINGTYYYGLNYTKDATPNLWLNGHQLKYEDGGYVDYTGPAWVDGSKSRPEAFLSAYQTEQIGALAKSLDPSTVNNATTNSNVTFGSINFNVASMSSAADGKKALDIFVQGANDMMAKKGIGTRLNINMK